MTNQATTVTPKTPFDVRREANEHMQQRVLGYRGVQVIAFVKERIDSDGQVPSYAMIRDALGFNHECHVSRVIARLESRGLLSREGCGRVRRIRLNGK